MTDGKTQSQSSGKRSGRRIARIQAEEERIYITGKENYPVVSFMEWVVAANRVCSCLGYPVVFAFQACIYWEPTPRNARLFWLMVLSIGLPLTAFFYYHTLVSGAIAGSWQILWKILLHFFWYWSVTVPFFWMTVAGLCVERALDLKRGTRRIVGAETPQFYGPRIVVLGNGPSLAKGEPLGHLIDGMDEVIRFNNFQTKLSGLERWTGSKTTVHFSDSMLFPTFPEYAAPGADVVLALFMDRLLVAGSYFMFRMPADLELSQTINLMFSQSLGWIPHEDINRMKATLGIDSWKHPTSGCLAIDWFSRHRPDKSVPIYIHGFDFFEGDVIHYYDRTEPFYERLNDRVGTTVMHQPHKEKAFIAKLVREGHVQWLRDLSSESKEK